MLVTLRDSIKGSSYLVYMISFDESKKKGAFWGLFFILVLPCVIMQPGFVCISYLGVDTAIADIEDNDNPGIVAEINGVPIYTHDHLKRYNLFLFMFSAVDTTMDRIFVNSYLDNYPGE